LIENSKMSSKDASLTSSSGGSNVHKPGPP